MNLDFLDFILKIKMGVGFLYFLYLLNKILDNGMIFLFSCFLFGAAIALEGVSNFLG